MCIRDRWIHSVATTETEIVCSFVVKNKIKQGKIISISHGKVECEREVNATMNVYLITFYFRLIRLLTSSSPTIPLTVEFSNHRYKHSCLLCLICATAFYLLLAPSLTSSSYSVLEGNIPRIYCYSPVFSSHFAHFLTVSYPLTSTT